MEPERRRDGHEEVVNQDAPREHQTQRFPYSSMDIRQILAFNSLHSRIADTLEPRIRQVVQEEVQRCFGLIPWNLERQSQMQISPEVPLYKLIFKNPPKTPIFAGAQIRDHEGSPLQILLVGPTGSPCSSPSPFKIELVALDGDFPSHDDWTSDEFARAIVRERAGKRPLLTGDVSNITMRDGAVTIEDLHFTDNSSWIRSRHFRVGVRVVSGCYEQTAIKETMTERFTVKDHRSELYRKSYPPVLTDEVWRLEKIGKHGAFHSKLSENNINNIQDFLKLWIVDPVRLRHILGSMTEKTWKRVIKHALTCNLGDKIYFYCGKSAVIYINSICHVVRIIVHGVPYTIKDLPKNYRDYVQHLVREAYQQWDNLREADELNANVALIQRQCLEQGGMRPVDWYPNNSQDSGVIDFKGDVDEGSSSVSYQFDPVSSWYHGMEP